MTWKPYMHRFVNRDFVFTQLTSSAGWHWYTACILGQIVTCNNLPRKPWDNLPQTYMCAIACYHKQSLIQDFLSSILFKKNNVNKHTHLSKLYYINSSCLHFYGWKIWNCGDLRLKWQTVFCISKAKWLQKNEIFF